MMDHFVCPVCKEPTGYLGPDNRCAECSDPGYYVPCGQTDPA